MLSASHWLLAQARFCGRTHLPLSPNSSDAHCSGDFPICTCFQHNNCGYGFISAITLLILSLSGYNPVNILWYTAPVHMMTFRWSHRSYQSICQQHPPYSHPQITLIYYSSWGVVVMVVVGTWNCQEGLGNKNEGIRNGIDTKGHLIAALWDEQ